MWFEGNVEEFFFVVEVKVLDNTVSYWLWYGFGKME